MESIMRKTRLLFLLLVFGLLADIGNIPAGKVHTGRFTFTSSSPSTDLLLTKVLLNGHL